MKWILIVYLLTNTPRPFLLSQPFEAQAACQEAGEFLAAAARTTGARIAVTCIQDGKP